MYIKKNNICNYLFLVLSLVYSASLYLWGIELEDNFYWINQSHNWNNIPMGILSMFCMSKWGHFFGYTIISYRILAWLLSTLSIIIVFWGLFDSAYRSKYLIYFSGAFLLVGSGIVKCCNPDYFTSFIMSCLLVCTYRMYESRTVFLIIITSLLSAISVAIRFPNILCIPLIFAFFIMTGNNKKERLRVAILYLILSCSLAWIIYFILYDYQEPITLIKNSIRSTVNNTHGSHSLVGLILRYAKSCLLSFVTLLIGFICYNVLCFFDKKYKKIYSNFLTICLGIVLTCSFFHFVQGSFGWSVGYVVINAIFLFVIAYRMFISGRKKKAFILIFIAMYCFIPSAGSDTGFFKSIIISTAIVPYVVSEVIIYYDKRVINIFCIIAYFVSLFIFNERIFNQTSYSSIPALRGILMEHRQKDDYESKINEIESYFIKDNTVFYGYNSSHFLYLCMDSKPLYNYSFWMERNDKKEIDLAINSMKNKSEFVFIDFSGSDENMFTSKGLRKVYKKDNTSIYKY